MGTATAALSAGGDTSGPGAVNTANTEDWNGASWSEVADLNTARSELSGAGSSTVGLAFGGAGPNANTEEWSSGNTTKTVDTD